MKKERTCRCPRHLSWAWRQCCHGGCGRSGEGGAACSAPVLCGRTSFFLFLFVKFKTISKNRELSWLLNSRVFFFFVSGLCCFYNCNSRLGSFTSISFKWVGFQLQSLGVLFCWPKLSSVSLFFCLIKILCFIHKKRKRMEKEKGMGLRLLFVCNSLGGQYPCLVFLSWWPKM